MYNLTLTADDVSAIAFIGYRYEWSNVLLEYDVGDNEIIGWKAWAIRNAIEDDMEGGHNAFPMLDPHSDLAAKLATLYLEIE